MQIFWWEKGFAPLTPQRATTINFRPSPLNSPKATGVAESPELMGEIRKESGLLPKAYVPDPKLEAALENLKRTIGKAGGA
jgi:hypothetical protein